MTSSQQQKTREDMSRVATWLFPPDAGGNYRDPNVFGTTVLINFAAWPMEVDEEREIEVHLVERDSEKEGGEDDLLAVFKGKLKKSKFPEKDFSYVEFTQSSFDDQKEAAKTAGKELLAEDAFFVGFHAPVAKKGAKLVTKKISLFGSKGEDENKTYEVGFKMFEGGKEQKTALDPALLFSVQGGDCLLDVPPWAQSSRERHDSKIKANNKGKHFPHLGNKTPKGLTDSEFYAEWIACSRRIPFLDTTQATLTSASLKLGRDALSMEEALKAHGVDGHVNVRARRVLLNPMSEAKSKKIETIAGGGCKLTSFSHALFHFGLYEEVLRQIVKNDADKAYFPHICAVSKCVVKESKTGDVCKGCKKRRSVNDHEKEEADNEQLNPFWFNAHVWWWLMTLEKGHKHKGGTYTDHKGNFSLNKALVETLGAEWLIKNEKDPKKDIARIRCTTKAAKAVASKRILAWLNRGIPVVVWVRSEKGGTFGHVNLIRGCEKRKGEWLFHFLDSGQGGWFNKATIDRFNAYTAFAPKGWRAESLHFRWR